MDENWQKALMCCAEGLYILDEETKCVVWANEYTDRTFGCSCIGRPCWESFLGRDEPCPFCPVLTEYDPVYAWDFFDATHKRWMKIKHLVFRNEGTLYRAGNINMMDDVMGLNMDTVREISQLRGVLTQKQGALVSLTLEANVDSLTGLWNRNRFQQDLERECTDAPGVGVLFFDLNNLKQINDRFRHATGDILLQRVAQALCAVRKQVPQARCYRIGGDEYVLLLTQSTTRDLTRCRELFSAALAAANKDQAHPCSVAVGQAFSAQPCDAELLVSQADDDMYCCKQRMKQP